jgi:8-oxo-dGTP diphosphatase
VATSIPVANRHGVVLHEMVDLREDQLEGPLPHPLTHALVVVRHAGRWLLLFNGFTQQWGLPGGVLEPGESARTCAERQLELETGQRAEELAYLGVMHVSFPPGRIEYGALFAAELGSMHPYAVRDGAARLGLWDGREDIGEVNEIHATLLTLASPSPAA